MSEVDSIVAENIRSRYPSVVPTQPFWDTQLVCEVAKLIRADERKLAREAMFKELCSATCFGCGDDIEILRENGKWMHADGDECAASIIRDANESAK